jgi:hypothetical protein
MLCMVISTATMPTYKVVTRPRLAPDLQSGDERLPPGMIVALGLDHAVGFGLSRHGISWQLVRATSEP